MIYLDIHFVEERNDVFSLVPSLLYTTPATSFI